MCCIFTCCGWMVDLIQRFWTFTMSCCISFAVCCSLVTASTAGIALGYNYSLAEYIDLKETNVSVYLKRGVFDDDISDDFDWRRSGHLPISGHIREDNLMTGSDIEETTTLRSGRRLDDSIYQTDDKNNFEDSLMRFTAKPPDFVSTTEIPSGLRNMNDIIERFPTNMLEQIKAVKGAINLRKMEEAARRKYSTVTTETPYVDVSNMAPFQYPKPNSAYRRMQVDEPSPPKSSPVDVLRAAVPDETINDPYKWMLPKLPPQIYSKGLLANEIPINNVPYTFPQHVTIKPPPIRPTRPHLRKLSTKVTTEPTRSTVKKSKIDIPNSIDEEMDTFKDKFMEGQLDTSRFKEDEYKQKIKSDQKSNYEDYNEMEMKGIPLRKKRSLFKLDEKYKSIYETLKKR